MPDNTLTKQEKPTNDASSSRTFRWDEVKGVLEGMEEAQIREIKTAPNIGRLHWLPTIKYEVVLSLYESRWHVVKGNRNNVQSDGATTEPDVLLHSHPIDERYDACECLFPSPADYYYIKNKAKNLIVSDFGITRYWQVETDPGNRAIEDIIFSLNPVVFVDLESYLPFLEGIVGARYEIYPWDQAHEQELRQFLRDAGEGYEHHLGEQMTVQKLKALLRP